MGLFTRDKIAKTGKRAFEAVTRLAFQNNWFGIASHINADLVAQGEALINQAREMGKNEPMAVKYLSLVANNVVGSGGISLHSQAVKANDPSTRDEEAAAAIEKAFKKWVRVGVADITGQNSFSKWCRLLVKTEARDGSSLVIEHKGRAVNDFGYGVQLIDSLRLAREKQHVPVGKENAIVSGVEIDNNGKPVAYYIHPELTGNGITGYAKKGNPKRVPADKVIHFYSQEYPEQIDGYSRMSAAMLRMGVLSKYQKSAGVAAAVGAAKMGFFITGDGEEVLGQMADDEDDKGGYSAEAVPGRIGTLPPGVKDFKSFNPDYPHAMYADFIKEGKRDVSTGLLVSYHGLSGDLEGVSFSSIRSGVLEEREQWLTLQDDLISGPLERIFNNWLNSALLAGAIKLPDGRALSASEIERLRPHVLRGRRWPWVDPLKDEQASEKAVNNLVESPYEVAARKGVDLDDALDDIERFQQGILKRKIVPMSLITGGQPSKQSASGEEDETENGNGG